MMKNGLTDVTGLQVGHWTNLEAATGCTVILCPTGMVAGVDIRGTAPGSRETALLNPVCMVENVHAILLGGGSAYGLAAADGVMQWLEERGHGFDVGVAKVPVVPAAILFDLPYGRPDVRPDAAAGYAACEAATSGSMAQGNVGAGTGATAGKFLGFEQATKSGLGTASRLLADEVVVAALVAVNPFGNIYDSARQQTIAGARLPDNRFADPMLTLAPNQPSTFDALSAISNTIIAVVATNVQLTKSQATKVAQMAQDGLARTTYPAHTHFDGDTVFAISHGEKQADLNVIGMVAADVLAEAIVSGVMAAEALVGLPAAQDLL